MCHKYARSTQDSKIRGLFWLASSSPQELAPLKSFRNGRRKGKYSEGLDLTLAQFCLYSKTSFVPALTLTLAYQQKRHRT